MHEPAEKRLADFLKTHFSVKGMRWFVRYRMDGLQISHALPGDPISVQDLAATTVDLLQKHGMIDRALFVDLLAERPRARDEILRIAVGFDLDTRGLVPAQTSLPKVSVVATVECLLIAGGAGYAIFELGRESLLISVTLAPLGLLRSEQSTERAARWYNSFDKALRNFVGADAEEDPLDYNLWAGFFLAVFGYTFIVLRPLVAGIIRILAVVRHPIAGARAFMINWRHQVLSVSLFSPAELVPNTRAYSFGGTIVLIGGMLKSLIIATVFGVLSMGLPSALWVMGVEMPTIFYILLLIVAFISFLYLNYPNRLIRQLEDAILGLLAIFLRTGIKASCVVWFPLILTSARREEVRMPVDLLIDYSHDGALPKLVRLAAIATLVGLVLLHGRALGLPLALNPPIQLDATAAIVGQIAAATACLLILVRDYAVLDTARFTLQEGRWTPPRVTAAISVLSRLVRVCVLLILICSLVLLYPTLEHAFRVAEPGR